MSSETGPAFTTETLVSSDGTPIGCRRIGRGRPLVLVHGGLLASQHLVDLAASLATDFEVVVSDRRCRGMSGPYVGGDVSVLDQEVSDVRAVIEHAGAQLAFGLSSGALVLLQAALSLEDIEKLAVYEPPLSVRKSAPIEWGARYERELAAGKTASALITGMHGLGVAPVMRRIPHLAAPLLSLMLRREKVAPGDVPIRDLVPTWGKDLAVIEEMADQVEAFAALRAQVLLMSGSRSPAWLGRSIDVLEGVLPHSQRVTLSGLDHQGPVDKPARVGPVLQEFFASPAAS